MTNVHVSAIQNAVWRVCRRTHALLMDGGVLDCVLECMCEDFKHFEEHAANRGEGSHSKTAVAGQVSNAHDRTRYRCAV